MDCSAGRIMVMRRQFATTMSLRLLLVALAVSGTSAIRCNFYDEVYDKETYAISSQEQLDRKYAGCTEIVGSLYIAANYTGRFYLPNVTTISSGISTIEHYSSERGEYYYLPTPSLTSIDVPDLNDTYSIDINSVPALTMISFPSLTVVNGSISIKGIEDCSVDFPSLTAVGNYLSITGNMSSLNFPVLTDVGYLRVSRNPVVKYDQETWGGLPLTFDRVDQLPLDISFPALQKTSTIYLQGNISSLSMPRLSTVGDTEQYYDRYVQIRTYGNPLNISLPSLSDLTIIALGGTIGSISFPSLRSLEQFTVNASTPLNITLEPIQTISRSFRTSGNVTAISMSSITTLESIHIESEFDGFYCSSIASDTERILGRKLKSYECTGHPPKSKLPLQLGLGIGLGIPVLAIIVYCIHRWCGRLWGDDAWTPKREDTPPEYELGVPPTYATDGPPTYDASEGERGSEQGAADVADGVRTGDGSNIHREGAGEPTTGDAASARSDDGSSAQHEAASGRRVV